MKILHLCLGGRTFGVLTKLDLMDKGTNALEVIITPTFTHDAIVAGDQMLESSIFYGF